MAVRLIFLSRLGQAVNNILLPRPTLSLHYVRQISMSSPIHAAMKVKMPSLSPTMYEGSIVQWYKNEGDVVSAGDIICDIQTDKAIVGFEMEEDGILAKILKPGDSKDIKIGTLIAVMVEEGDDWQNVEIPTDTETSLASEPNMSVSQPNTSFMTPSHHSYGPAVRSILDQYNISLADVQGTGPHNRVLKGDLLQYIKGKNLKPSAHAAIPLPQAVLEPFTTPSLQTKSITSPEAPVPAKKPTAKQLTVSPDGVQYVDLELSNMRKIIAKRLTESKISTPHAYSTIDCNLTSVTELRKEFSNEGIKVSMNDIIIKAVAVSLQRVPEVNAIWTGDGGRAMSNIDISVAVATDSGLITPIVKDAIGLGIEDISKCIRELASRAREGKLKPDEFQGGTFTISNLGMFGVSEFTAVINPPQACIMAIGTSRLQLDQNGKPQTYMKVTLSADSRIVNEFLATRFLETFKEVMENPMLMLSQGPTVDIQKLFAK